MLVLIAALASAPVSAAPDLQPQPAAAQPDLQSQPACRYCGMDRAKFAHSRMHLEYEDGSSTGVCSLHCAAVELAVTVDKSPKALWVGDLSTKALVDAEHAVWVLGGSKPGVMTKRAKWAFADRGTAEAFVKEHGGAIVTFEDAIKAAYEDMYADSRMIREKRKAAQRANAPSSSPAQQATPAR